MPDDTNDKMMAQFIERATPKLLEAMAEQIKTNVEEQLGGFKDHATKLLDEVKDAKRAREEQNAKFSQFEQLLKQNPNDTQQVHDGLQAGDDIVLTRAQARDPAIYKRAKAQAEAKGVQVQIDRDA